MSARRRAFALLGEPAEQWGHPRDPRSEVIDGVRCNERWVYRVRKGPRAGRLERILFFTRGELLAVRRAGDDGSLAEENVDALFDGSSGDDG